MIQQHSIAGPGVARFFVLRHLASGVSSVGELECQTSRCRWGVAPGEKATFCSRNKG
jgi:hypothetical protein